MSYARQLCLFLICCACAVAAPCFAQLSPTLILFHSMPEIDGAGRPTHTIYLLPGMTQGFTLAQVDQPGGLSLAALETMADPNVLIKGLLIQSQEPIKIVSDPNDAALPPPFRVPWTITKTPSGVLLSWSPGAAELGQVIGGTPPDNRYTLILSIDHKENPDVNFGVDHHFTVTAVPEPGAGAFFAGLIAAGMLARRRKYRA
jgi:hypothetical protein